MALCCRGELLTIQDVAVRLGQIMWLDDHLTLHTTVLRFVRP